MYYTCIISRSQQSPWKYLISYSKQETTETVTNHGAIVVSCSAYGNDDIANC